MTNDRDIYNGGRTQGIAGWGTTEMSKQQVRHAVMSAIATLDAKGIRPCEILFALAEQSHRQGDRKAAEALLKAAFELRQAGSLDLPNTHATQDKGFDDSLTTPFASTWVEGNESTAPPPRG
ncbi:MAG: hypothetical protein LDL41_15265 [Coleofasciculus sp. S288]|nr:hypothetical protein [Coleofasciculus sp. S288]